MWCGFETNAYVAHGPNKGTRRLKNDLSAVFNMQLRLNASFVWEAQPIAVLPEDILCTMISTASRKWVTQTFLASGQSESRRGTVVRESRLFVTTDLLMRPVMIAGIEVYDANAYCFATTTAEYSQQPAERMRP